MKALFRGNILTIPNILSLIRVCLIPLFVWLYLAQDDVLATAIVLLLSGLTDALDGFIARHFNMISDFGKALDPFADKLTQFAMLCCLVIRYPRMIWLIVVLCVKEICVAISQIVVIQKRDLVLGAAWHGKVTTILLYAVMTLHLLWLEIPDALSWALVLLCICMLLLSGVLYGIRNYRATHQEPDKAENTASSDEPAGEA